MSEGFFSRWSQRKQAAREAAPTPAPTPRPVPDLASPLEAPLRTPAHTRPGVAGAAQANPDSQAGSGRTDPAPVPTLDDVQALTPDSDFSPFMQHGVTPEVRNAAVKRLFADPHFNVMDGLDIYIDDYNRPDPLPAGMLQKMVGARLLGLVRDDPPQSAQPAAPAAPEAAPLSPRQPPPPSEKAVAVAQSQPACADPSEPTPHDHAHLQLQPDPAPGPSGPGAPRG